MIRWEGAGLGRGFFEDRELKRARMREPCSLLADRNLAAERWNAPRKGRAGSQKLKQVEAGT